MDLHLHVILKSPWAAFSAIPASRSYLRERLISSVDF